jgi:predicted exporter
MADDQDDIKADPFAPPPAPPELPPPDHEPPQIEPEVEAPSAAARLRALEDEWFGPDTTRVNGRVVDGHGSPFAQLPAEKKAHHRALHRAVHAEQKLADARSALTAAEQEAAAAEHAVETTFLAAVKAQDHDEPKPTASEA